VEVDSSYYAMPLPVTTQQWAERTPDEFVFNVKAFRLFTGHQAQPRVFPKDIRPRGHEQTTTRTSDSETPKRWRRCWRRRGRLREVSETYLVRTEESGLSCVPSSLPHFGY